MSIKYKIENAKLNKKLFRDEVTVSKIKSHGPSGPKWSKQPTTRQILADFIKEQRAFNKNISQRLTNIVESNGLKE